MSLEIIIEDKAAKDIREANDWYFQKSIQAAANFENEIRESLEQLKTGIIEHREITQGVHVITLSAFPSNVYYKKLTEKNIIHIVAVLHNKRNPDFVLKRLSET